MPVIDVKPHKLSLLRPADGYVGDNGDWFVSGDEWGEPHSCHAAAAGSANLIAYADGTTAAYTYTVGRLPADMAEVAVGTKARLTIGEDTAEYTVKGFHRYQLQCKIWV